MIDVENGMRRVEHVGEGFNDRGEPAVGYR